MFDLHRTADKNLTEIEMELRSHRRVESPQFIKNPMMLNPIIKHAYSFLDLDDLKNCRLVCQEWNTTAKLIISRRSKIFICVGDEERTLEKYKETFSKSSDIITFHAFKFLGESCSVWNKDELEGFLKENKSNIRELEIGNINLVNSNGRKIDHFDITSWLSELALAIPNPKAQYNRKLAIVCHDNFFPDQMSISVQSKVLANVEDITLKNCIVNTKDVIPCCPTELTLIDVTFQRDDEFLSELNLSKLVNFSKSREITIQCESSIADRNTRTSRIIIDVGRYKNVKLNNLILDNVNVINWQMSKWISNLVQLTNVPLMQKIEMQIVELQFHSSEINLSILPQSIEKLSIRSIGRDTNLSITTPIALWKLKSLFLGFMEDNPIAISYFRDCPNLVDVHIEGYYLPLKVELDWMPKSIERIRLTRVPIVWEKMERTLYLEKLVLDEFTFDSAKLVSHKNVRVKDLVLLCLQVKRDHKHESFLDYFKYITSFDFAQQFRVGLFHTFNASAFQTCKDCHLASYVDKTAMFYEFKNHKGIGIDSHDFELKKERQLRC